MRWLRNAEIFCWLVGMLLFVFMAMSNVSKGIDCHGECIMALLCLILSKLSRLPEMW